MKYYAEYLTDAGTIAVDDTLLVKGAQAAAGSRILEGFKPLFSAEAVDRLEAEGYVISGKAHVGEFGLDELTTDRRDAIGEDMTLEVVVLVLDNTCSETIICFRMLGKVLI